MKKRRGFPLVFLSVLLLTALLLSGQPAARAAEDDTTEETVLYGTRVSPYLLPGAQGDTVILRWTADSDQPVLVHYGLRNEPGTAPAETTVMEISPQRAVYASCYTKATWFYSAELSIPESGYAYGLSEPGGVPSRWYDIAGENDGVLTAFLTSDSHISNEKEAGRIEAVLDSLSPVNAPELICHTGDVNEDVRLSPNILIQGMESLRTVPIAAVCGNHDAMEKLYEFFRMPGLVMNRPNPNYTAQLLDYCFEKEDVLFIGLNMKSMDFQSHGDFIRKAVADHPDCRWTVVMIHYSLFSNGSHGKDSDPLQFQRNMAKVFSETDVDLVLSGHDHEYDRSLLYKGEEPQPGTDDVIEEKRQGETLYISLPTTTGTKFYRRVTEINEPPAVEALKFAPGYVLTKFSRDAIILQAYSIEGELVDAMVLKHPEA